MINTREKLADIALQDPDSFGVIPARLPRESIEAVERLMSAFADAAGVRMRDERAVEKRIELPMDRVMDY